MEIFQKQLSLSGVEYYAAHLHIINSLLKVKMTHTEIDILSNFFNLDKAITEDYMFNTLARKMVKENMDNMSNGAFSNHLKSLINKGFLIKHPISNRISIKEYLIPLSDVQGYQFKISKKY